MGNTPNGRLYFLCIVLLMVGVSSCDKSNSNAPAATTSNAVSSNDTAVEGSEIKQPTADRKDVTGNTWPAVFSVPVTPQGQDGERTRALMRVDSNGQPVVAGSNAGAGFNYDVTAQMGSAFSGTMVPSYWCVGAEQIFDGKFDCGSGLIFDSDNNYPLTFKLLKDKGLVYMCGRGAVTMPGGKITRLGDDDTIETYIPLLVSKDIVQREAAAQALGDLTKTAQDKDRIVPRLIAALDDNTFQVRRNAAEALGKLKDKRAIQALNARSSEKIEKDEWVRKVAMEALNKLTG